MTRVISLPREMTNGSFSLRNEMTQGHFVGVGHFSALHRKENMSQPPTYRSPVRYDPYSGTLPGLSIDNLTLSQNKPWFLRVCSTHKSFENTVGKGEIARYEQILLFPQCFLHVLKTFCHFRQNLNCSLQIFSVWKSLKFDFRERV